jgi:mannan endo-1,4-beta-mannosidase
VAEAKARGLRLILTLTNNGSDFGGLDAYARWAGKSQDDFFGDPTMMGYWKEHAATLLARIDTLTGVAYRDGPAILRWELANELRCRACAGGTR